MHLKKIMPVFAIAIGLVLAVATSAFKQAPKGNVNPYFYKYQGPNFLQQNIEEPSNYTRASLSCSGTTNVCGVFLTIDEGTGNPPDASDFDSESANLWSSQQAHHPADGNIKMRN